MNTLDRVYDAKMSELNRLLSQCGESQQLLFKSQYPSKNTIPLSKLEEAIENLKDILSPAKTEEELNEDLTKIVYGLKNRFKSSVNKEAFIKRLSVFVRDMKIN